MQAVLAAGAEVEAEVELGGGVDLHRRLKLLRRCRAASPIGRRNASGESASARASAARPSSLQRRPRWAERAGLHVLQRAGQGLAPVGEGGADELASRRVGRRARCAAGARIAESTRGRGRKTAGSTLRTSSHLAGELGDARSATRRCGCRAPRATGRRSRAAPSRSRRRSEGSCSIVRRITGVATE